MWSLFMFKVGLLLLYHKNVFPDGQTSGRQKKPHSQSLCLNEALDTEVTLHVPSWEKKVNKNTHCVVP